jgi:fused signal recognition particle receptor
MGLKNAFQRLAEGLTKTRSSFVGKVQRLFTTKTTVDDELLEKLEEILLASDVGVSTTQTIINGMKERAKKDRYESTDDLVHVLKEEMIALLPNEGTRTSNGVPTVRPHIIMVVGVNGVGKTTTIGKLAARFSESGHRVIIGAADTFRAAANEQLEIWAQRAARLGSPKSNVEIIQQAHGADPASVAFDTLSSAIARNADVVIIDTAGRLHTKVNLMEELKKIARVLDKRMPGAPHEVLLVLDASTGQNALQQARQFSRAVPLTGLVITKLDGTAKGGVVLGVSHELKIPVKYIGVGEGLDDLQPFDAKDFVGAMFENSEEHSITS